MSSNAKKKSIIIGSASCIFIILEFLIIKSIVQNVISKEIIKNLFLSLFTIGSGIFCSFYYSENKFSKPIIYFLYCLGLSIFNFYFENPKDEIIIIISSVLFDVFGTLTVFTFFVFISRSFHGNRKFSFIRNISLISCIITTEFTLLKYFLISLNPNFTILHNPFFYLVHLMIFLSGLTLIILSIYLLASASRQATMLLRYLSMGIFYALFAFFAYCIKNIIMHIPIMHFTTKEFNSIAVTFLYLPLIQIASVFQYRSEKINYLIRRLLIWLGFSSNITVILSILYKTNSMGVFKNLSVIVAVTAPIYFYLAKTIVNAFLTLESRTIKNDLENFNQELDKISDSKDAYILTATKITKLIHCRYIFFYVQQEGNDYQIPYSTADKNIVIRQIKQSDKIKVKKEIQSFEDDTFAYVYYQGKTPFFKIFIGTKYNSDEYLPSEMSLVSRYGHILVENLLQKYSRKLTTEFQTISRHSKQVDQELLLASYVQQSFYPQNYEKPNGWELNCYFKAMSGVSGDLYDFFLRDKKLDGLAIFDVSGHGIGSALVAMLVHNIIHQEFYLNKDKKIKDVLKIIDKRFKSEKNNIENFMTGILIRIVGNNIQLVNGAHPDPILYKKSEDKLYFLNQLFDIPRSNIIGFDGIEPKFTDINMDLESGDELILYTDGIYESINNERKQYGRQRLMETIHKNISLSIEEQSKSLIDDLNTFVGDTEAYDDITVIFLRKE